jgi:hypothetical protein
MPFKKLPDPMARILVVFVVLGGGILAIRYTLPPSITSAPLHIESTMKREMARPVRYSGPAACGDCHEEAGIKKTGYHRMLSCETCHGPAQRHVDNPGEAKPEVPRRREFCAGCHQYDPSRPTGFPQINPVAHNPLQPCVSCHNPHDPKPPSVPGECEACHAEIARTKAVSPHVQLSCTTCHTVPEQHKVAPRATAASIPAEREFCGKCHGQSAPKGGPPRVDMNTHGEKYLCWQCHYPHMPEVK